ncbi:uncharacterized protein LOC107046543 isoform X2 [Diachasma alloeum]|uniref:uncharacterized protein LOC107046543 isoform X2 n=1 Tax=Diachasma alloeum TaxID=454923 RepID=UPI0007382C28|nr:uncharacterized protein LOC107046543 isoform X2 [Diachasma alloeum]
MWLTESSVLFRHLRETYHSHVIISKFKFSAAVRRYSPRKNSSTFTEEEEAAILDTINKCEASDFARYDIKEGQLKRLLALRTKNGGFQDFNDVLITQDVASLIKFCRSILLGGKKVKSAKGNSSSKSIVTPAITDVTRFAIKSILGLHVWGNAVSWSLLESDGQINHWELEKFDNLSKMNIVSLVDLIKDMTLRLPYADAYVMEADSYSALGKLKSSAYFVHLQRQQIIAMIMSGIRMRECITNRGENSPNFYLMQARSPGKLFNLIVGSETVSAKGVISRIISDREVMYLPHLPPIVIDPNIVAKYNSQEIATREQMHSVLLLTLAFYNQIYVKKNVSSEIKTSQ